MDYSKTVNLPRTDFPMRANLPEREPQIQALWERLDLYRRTLEQRRQGPRYLLHDGPPYTSGPIHLGQALNKVLKDIVVKYRTMQGCYAPFVPGWDMHGLPTEMQALKTFKGTDRHAIPIMELRRECQRTAAKFMELQRTQFQRLGVRADWDHPYLTATPEYEQAVLGVFGDLVARECIYRGLKPVWWCPTCETALAEAEVEYETSSSASIYVRFRVVGAPAGLLPGVGPGDEVYLLIWTTTPWTLPANLALAVHPMYQYAVVATERYGKLVVAAELVGSVMEVIGAGCYQVLGTLAGQQWEGVRTRHPFLERESPVVLADYVTLEQGTGVVHTAPGHGKEDYLTGLQYNLPVLSPVDEQGRFTAEAGKYAGMKVQDADPLIIEDMRAAGSLLWAGQLAHQYPHCWRCQGEVIFRATSQWFMAVDMFTEEALAAIDQVRWIPAWGRERIANMVAQRPDWCLSRQRAWGIGIPAFYCQACQEPLLTAASVEHVRGIVAEHGADAWFAWPVERLLLPGARCGKCGGSAFRKEQDVFDVWFDSASSHQAVLAARPELGWPADLYLEGSDQYRGWFQVSLWTGVAAQGAAPYRAVLAHGFFLDETGRKMSKSLGNIVDPQDVVRRYGADVLRLWVSYVDFKSDMPMSEDIFTQVTDAYRRIRNTVRFLLGNLYDFDPAAAVPREQMLEADRWALHRLQWLLERVTAAYQEFEFHRVYHALNTFCAVELSAFYLDMLKDRLYTSAPASLARRSAQTALYHLAAALAKVLAPILTHTAEEIWQHLPGAREESVQLADWPRPDPAWVDPELGGKWDRLLIIRGEAAKAIEIARNRKLISQPLAAQVVIWAAGEERALLEETGPDLASILIVSQVRLAAPDEPPPEGTFASQEVAGLALYVQPAAGRKCERCWLYSPTVGADAQYQTLCARCAATLKGEG